MAPAERRRIVILNGASSAGKSSIGRALQEMLEPTPLLLQMDFFTPMLPIRGHIAMPHDQRTNENSDWPHAPLRWIFPEREGDPIRIEANALAHQLIRGMFGSAAALADAGSDVILDFVLMEDHWIDGLIEAMADHDATFIAIDCALDELDRRERARGDRPIGLARAQAALVHRHGIYDLRIDSTNTSAQENATTIAAALEAVAEPRALAQLRAARP